MPGHVEKQADGSMKAQPIMPFWLLDPTLLPMKQRNTLKVNWHSVYKIMDEAIVSGDSHPTEMSTEELESWWVAGDELLRTRVAFLGPPLQRVPIEGKAQISAGVPFFLIFEDEHAVDQVLTTQLWRHGFCQQ